MTDLETMHLTSEGISKTAWVFASDDKGWTRSTGWLEPLEEILRAASYPVRMMTLRSALNSSTANISTDTAYLHKAILVSVPEPIPVFDDDCP